MMKKLGWSALALIVSTTPVLAADAIMEAPAVPPEVVETTPVFSWAGGYIGLHGGYAWGEGDFYDGVVSATDDFDGGRFGGFVGYNWGFGSDAIVGLEADLKYDWNENS